MATPKPRRFRLETLFRRIGEITVTWAYLEHAVDAVIHVVHHDFEGKTVNPEIPSTPSFARKMTYLREWYASHEKWEVLFPQFLDVVTLLEAASTNRHRIIHGLALEIGAYEKTGINKVERRIRKKRTVTIETATYTIAGMRNLRNHILALAAFMGHFHEILSDDPVLKNEPDQSLGKLFMKLGGFFPVRKRSRNLPDNGG